MGVRLARAHLFRMRGQWPAAVEECSRVIQVDPTNAAAHSLLGDIYQDQGRTEEACYWYQLALELNPNSVADRAKLSRTEELLEGRNRREEWEAIIEGRVQPISTGVLVREAVWRVLAIAGAVLAGIILVMASLVSVADQAGVRYPGEEPSILPAAPTAKAMPTLTVREQGLTKLLTAPALRGKALLERVELDPRSRGARIRLFVKRSHRVVDASAEPRLMLMREGYRFASRLYNYDRTLERIEIDIIGANSSRDNRYGAELLMAGTLARENLVVDPDLISREELEKFYGEQHPVWWAADLSGF